MTSKISKLLRIFENVHVDLFNLLQNQGGLEMTKTFLSENIMIILWIYYNPSPNMKIIFIWTMSSAAWECLHQWLILAHRQTVQTQIRLIWVHTVCYIHIIIIVTWSGVLYHVKWIRSYHRITRDVKRQGWSNGMASTTRHTVRQLSYYYNNMFIIYLFWHYFDFMTYFGFYYRKIAGKFATM